MTGGRARPTGWIVEETCREFGLPYKEHPTLRAGLAAHFRWLRRLGSAD